MSGLYVTGRQELSTFVCPAAKRTKERQTPHASRHHRGNGHARSAAAQRTLYGIAHTHTRTNVRSDRFCFHTLLAHYARKRTGVARGSLQTHSLLFEPPLSPHTGARSQMDPLVRHRVPNQEGLERHQRQGYLTIGTRKATNNYNLLPPPLFAHPYAHTHVRYPIDKCTHTHTHTIRHTVRRWWWRESQCARRDQMKIVGRTVRGWLV